MSEFETLRAHLSHFLLRNEILARFGISADILSACGQDRIAKIANCMVEVDPSSANVRAAINAWHRGGSSEQGVNQAMADLLAAVSELKSLRPTSKFPDKDKVSGWIKQMEVCITSLERTGEYTPDERRRLARGFAEATVLLLDFLANLDAYSKEFCGYFERLER